VSQKLVREGSTVKVEIPMTRVCCVCIQHPSGVWLSQLKVHVG